MNARSPITSGWPFLVARGRRRGYSTLLAPSFLIAEGDYGVLEEAVGPTAEPGQAEVLRVNTRAGRTLAVAYATHVVTAADLAPAQARSGQAGSGQAGSGQACSGQAGSGQAGSGQAGSGQAGSAQAGPPSAPPPRDEHSRPLTLLYGFVCRDAWISEPAPADLRFAHETALRVYQSFLDEEEGFTVVAADSYDLRSPVVTGRTPVVNSGHHPAYADMESPARQIRPRPVFPRNLAIFVLAVVIVAVFAVIWLGRPDGPDLECLNGANAAAHAVVDCDDPTARFKVLGKIPGKTPAESKNIGICRSHKGTTATFWQGGEGKRKGGTGNILCLAPAD